MPIIFDEETHTYTNTETNENYISVTTLLGKYKPKFDSQLHAERVAKREGLPVDVVLEFWKDLNVISTDKGHEIHKILEEFIINGTPDKKHQSLLDYIGAQISNNGHFKVAAEQRFYNHENKIAGTADVLFENANYFKIWDLKTNKKIRFTNDFPDDKFLLEPVDHLVNCEYSAYALQLSLYAYMQEALTGKKCLELKIIFLNPKDDLYNIEEIYVPYLKYEIEQIIKHHLNDFPL
jgi:hypothetical protein